MANQKICCVVEPAKPEKRPLPPGWRYCQHQRSVARNAPLLGCGAVFLERLQVEERRNDSLGFAINSKQLQPHANALTLTHCSVWRSAACGGENAFRLRGSCENRQSCKRLRRLAKSFL